MKLSKSSIAILIVAIVFGIIASAAAILPFLAERFYRDGFNLIQGRQYPAGISKLKVATKLAPFETQYKVELGRGMEDYAKTLPSVQAKVMLEEIKPLYETLLDLDDRNPWYLNRMAAVYNDLATLDVEHQSENQKVAEGYIRKAAAMDPNNPLFQLNLAYFLQNRGDLKEAKTYYERAIQIDGRISEARFNLAALYLGENKPDQALEQYLEILKNTPEMPGLLPAIGRLYLTQKQPQIALPYLERNTQLFPFDRMGLILLAETYNQLRQTPKTIETLDLAVKRFPDDTQSRRNLIQLYRLNGQNAAADQQEALLGAFLNTAPK